MIQSSSSPVTRLSRSWSRWFAIGALSATGLLLGWVPEFSPQTSAVSWSHAAQAQSFSDSELRNYARSVLAIETLRQSSFRQIQGLLGNQSVPSIRCDEPRSLNGLPQQARQIAVDYCDGSQDLVERNGLSIQRFNEITEAQAQDAGLASRIQQILVDLQRNR